MYRHKTFHRGILATAITTALFSANTASAQAPEEIIVSADFREATLQNSTGSISIIDEETITRQNGRHLEEVMDSLPNVNYASGASRARFYQIRGIGERGQFAEPLNPSVGLLIDGVDFSGIGTVSTLWDLEQVEVLLGPQGTRYGSNALAGLINLKSKAPTEQFSAGVQAGAGNQDTRELAAYASGPVTDSLLYRVSAQSLKSDGFSENLTLGRPTNTKDEETIRGKLVWQASDSSTLSLNATLIDIDNGYDVFSLDNVRDTLSDEPGFDRQDTKALSATWTQNLGDLTLEVQGSTADSDIEYGFDEDWAYVGIHPEEYSSTDHYYRNRDNDSLELRLLSDDNGNFSWVAGLYGLQQDVSLERINTYLASPYFSEYELDRTAFYVDTSTRITDRLSIDAGLRLERFEGSFTDSENVRFSPEESLEGGRLTLRYEFDDNTLLFAGVSRGYKTGGFNTDGSLDADLREFDAEYLWNYEAGIKKYWPQHLLSLQATLFTMDRDDVQIGSSTTRDRGDGSSEFIDYTGNAAAGTNSGLELSLQWQATQKLSVNGSLGLLDSEYEDFVNAIGDDLDGREQAHAPSYQFSLTTAWQFTPALSGSLTLNGKDSYYFSDSHDTESDAYETLHAQLAWQQDNWSVRLWGRNLTDEDYYVRGFYFGNDPRDGYTEKGYTQLGENRRYGVTVNLEF